MKADLAIYGNIVNASGQCISVSLILGFKNWISVLVPIGTVVVSTVTYSIWDQICQKGCILSSLMYFSPPFNGYNNRPTVHVYITAKNLI